MSEPRPRVDHPIVAVGAQVEQFLLADYRTHRAARVEASNELEAWEVRWGSDVELPRAASGGFRQWEDLQERVSDHFLYMMEAKIWVVEWRIIVATCRRLAPPPIAAPGSAAAWMAPPPGVWHLVQQPAPAPSTASSSSTGPWGSPEAWLATSGPPDGKRE